MSSDVYDSFLAGLAQDAQNLIKNLTRSSLDFDQRYLEVKAKSAGKPVMARLVDFRYVIQEPDDVKEGDEEVHYEAYEKNGNFDKMKVLKDNWKIKRNILKMGYLVAANVSTEISGQNYTDSQDYQVFDNPSLYVQALKDLQKEGHPFFSGFAFDADKLLKLLTRTRKKEQKCGGSDLNRRRD